MKRKIRKFSFWKPTGIKRPKPVRFKPKTRLVGLMPNPIRKKLMSKSIFRLKPNYKRTKRERILIRKNPWGDRDGDALPNWIDCKPFNRRRQGEFDNIIKRYALKKTKEYAKAKEQLTGRARAKLLDNPKIQKIMKAEMDDFRYDDDDEYAIERKAGYEAAKEAQEEAERDAWEDYKEDPSLSREENAELRHRTNIAQHERMEKEERLNKKEEK